jgi:hypothetical protein
VDPKAKVEENRNLFFRTLLEWLANARLHLLLEACAARTLEAVRCKP